MLNKRLKRRIRYKSNRLTKKSFTKHLIAMVLYCNYNKIGFLYPEHIQTYKGWAKYLHINLNTYLNKIEIK